MYLSPEKKELAKIYQKAAMAALEVLESCGMDTAVLSLNIGTAKGGIGGIVSANNSYTIDRGGLAPNPDTSRTPDDKESDLYCWQSLQTAQSQTDELLYRCIKDPASLKKFKPMETDALRDH